MSKPDGGSAFPTPEFYDERLIGTGGGMTLRDYFAAKALTGLLASIDTFAPQLTPGTVHETTIATMAYELADAMLAERAK